MSSSLNPGRPPTACRRCKQQKVRCSGNTPNCQRCSRLGIPCEYPQPSQSLAVPRPRYRHGALEVSRQPSLPLDTTSQPPIQHFNPLTILQSPDYLGIPKPLVSDLVDTFFSHLYNSRLLLHKGKFQEDRQRDAVKPHILLAVCAMGAKFHRTENDTLPFRDFAPIWAERAGKLVLNEVEEPHEDNIVTLLILTLFWYMEGAWRKSFMYKGIGFQTANLLGLVNNSEKGKTPLEGELSRRRFWACYLNNCHISNSIFQFRTSGRAGSLPLPWPEADFELGISTTTLVPFDLGVGNGGIHSELIRAMTHWSTVDSLLKTPGSNHQERIATIHQLDAKVREWWAQVPSNLHLTPTNIITFHRLDLTKILLINTAFHQSLCALHASIVPLFTWGPHPPTLALSHQLSAQVAYENACAISQLFRMVLDYNADTSDFSSFLGYSAYCSFAVQVPFKWCLDSTVKESATINTEINLRIIQGLSRYWKFVSLLATFAQYLGEIHSQHQLGLESEPKGLSLHKLRGFCISAADARSSMLSMNGILWKDDGCAVQGDELPELALNDESNNQSSSQVAESTPVSIPEEDTRLSGEEASVTTLYDLSPPSGARVVDFSRMQPPVLFHPFIHSSEMLDLAADSLGFMDFDIMN